MKRVFLCFLCVLLVVILGSHCVCSSTCSSDSKLRIHSSEINCGLRPQVVQLSLSSLGDDRVSRIIPGSVFVERCSGACDALTCVPSSTENMTLQVMAVLTRYSQGEWNTVCTTLKLEKHLGCTCSCPRDDERSNCSGSNVFYDSSSCRCKCKDRSAPGNCLRQGKVWIEQTCGCVCPQSSWRPCGTGFTFDYRDTCTCVRAYNLASGNHVTLAVFVIGILSMSIAGSVLWTLRVLRRRASEQRRHSLRMRLKEAFGSSESLDEIGN